MRELKDFIKGLEELEFEVVSIGEVFEEEFELIHLEDLFSRIKSIGIKEIVAQYFNSFEIITNEGKYIEVVGAC